MTVCYIKFMGALANGIMKRNLMDAIHQACPSACSVYSTHATGQPAYRTSHGLARQDVLQPFRLSSSSLLKSQAVCTNSKNSYSLTTDALDTVLPHQMEALPLENNADQLASCIDFLLKAHYAAMTDKFSWMQRNVHIAYIQLILNQLFKQETKQVQEHRTYKVLYDNLLSSHGSLSDGSLVQSTLSMIYLGMDQTDPLMHQLLVNVRSLIPSVPPSILGSISQLYKSMLRTDVFMTRALCKRLSEISQSDPARRMYNAKDYHGICTTFLMCYPFISNNLLVDFFDFLLATIHINQHQDWFSDPDHLGMLATTLQKSSVRAKQNGCWDKCKAIVAEVVKACLSASGKMESHNIAEICQALKGLRVFDHRLASVFQTRAMALLDQDHQLNDVSNLCYCITPNAEQTMKIALEMSLYSKLGPSMPDIIIISNLASSLPDFGFIEKDLLRQYQHLIAVNAERIVEYISRYHRVARFLQRKKFVDYKDEVQFIDTIMRHIDLQHGIGMFTFSSIATYLLPSYREKIPSSLFQKLLTVIPRWAEADLYRLAMGLKAIKRPVGKAMRRQVDDLQMLLHSTLVEKLHTVATLDRLCHLTLGLSVHNQSSRDPTLTSELMDKFPQFTSNISGNDLIRVVQIFQALKYHLPEVYEDIARSAVDNSNGLDAEKVSLILACLAQVGHQPQNFNSFVLLCLDAFTCFEEQGNYEGMLKTTVNLIHLCYQPEEELGKIFTLDFIQKLDSYILGKKSMRSRLMNVLMELNRAVVLECPQLDTPWFHQNYCYENVATAELTDDPVMTRFRDDVGHILAEILGSEDCVRRWVYTPHFYSLDLECILDEHNQALNVQNVTESGIKRSWQRVAILTQGEDKYCYNSRQLDGPNQTKIRHLEMMDYKVVQIPHFEWFSMGLAEWQAKAEYLQDKIFEEDLFQSD